MGVTGSNIYIAKATDLPSQYKQVEYIQSSGTQFIDTGMAFTNDTKVDLDICLPVARAGWSGVMGCQYMNTSSSWAFGVSPSTATYQQNNRSVDWNWSPDANTKYKITNDGRYIYIDGVQAGYITNTYSSYTTPGNGTIFKVNYTGSSSGFAYNASAKVYACKIYNGSTLVRDFVPCVDTLNNNAAGLYDMVEGAFHGNSGTGTFTVGAFVSGYYQVKKMYVGKGVYEGYYDMVTDNFYSDSNLTQLITPVEGEYYKYIRYTTPIFYKYTNGHFVVQKKNETTVTKNSYVSLASSLRRELCCRNGRGVGVVSGQNGTTYQLLKRTDIDTVNTKTQITGPNSAYCGFNTKAGTIISGEDKSSNHYVYIMTLDYENNSITSSSITPGFSSYGGGQGNSIDKTGTVGYLIDNSKRYYAKITIASDGSVSGYNMYSNSSAPNNICGGVYNNGKMYCQGHQLSSVGIGTPSADGTSISWTNTANHNLTNANSIGGDRYEFLAVGSTSLSRIAYSFNNGSSWNTLDTSYNTGGQIYVDEIGDIWYTGETAYSVVGRIRFGTFLTEEELV